MRTSMLSTGRDQGHASAHKRDWGTTCVQNFGKFVGKDVIAALVCGENVTISQRCRSRLEGKLATKEGRSGQEAVPWYDCWQTGQAQATARTAKDVFEMCINTIGSCNLFKIAEWCAGIAILPSHGSHQLGTCTQKRDAIAAPTSSIDGGCSPTMQLQFDDSADLDMLCKVKLASGTCNVDKRALFQFDSPNDRRKVST
eukprot:6098762-Amphidinium_carterae.1